MGRAGVISLMIVAIAQPAFATNAKPTDSDAEKTSTATNSETTKKPVEPTQASPWLELDNEDYRFVGLRFRLIHLPKFMFGLFGADGGKAVTAWSAGPEYVMRRNGFETDLWLTYAAYGMGNAPFKARSDPDEAYEIVKSELKTISVGADFLWTVPLNDKGLSLAYGGGAGIGVVFGNLYRNQAYPPSGSPSDPNTYVKCPGPGSQYGSYCGTDNDHYGNYSEPNWLNGGTKPFIFPWLALPQVGLRWKPNDRFVVRLDTGLSLPGPFFVGLSGQYGLL